GCVPLDEHLLFSTGWEWGYWLNDVVSLRASYEQGSSAEDLLTDAYAPDLGVAAGHFVGRLMAAQKKALIDQRLIGYLVGRDIAIDAGDRLDPPIISQPDRITFEDLVANRQLEAALIIVLADLDAYATTLDGLESELDALDLPDSRWSSELRDGVAIDRLRVRFVNATYNAVLAFVRNQNFAPDYEKAKELLARARKLVASRHADLHDNHGRRLVDKTANHTFYQFGYLYMADTLCYWQRELDQVGQILGTSTAVPNTCLF
ncbi:MAG TPA: hypothetical protein VFV99_15815, partial [Kofleriaceae bacterium]|nr:hypothetical protein [Kofleriaceae bacterium]